MSKLPTTSRDELRKALDAAGIEASTLSLAIGRGKDYIGDFLRGKKAGLRADEFEKIRAVIARGVNDATPAPIASLGAVQLISVRGFVQAGIWQEVLGMEDLATDPDFTAAPHPRYPVAEQFVLAVRGDSMNAASPIAIPDGAFVKCVSMAAYGREPKDKIVVVHKFRDSGGLVEATLKRMRVFSDRVEFQPESTNTRYLPIVVNGSHSSDVDEYQIIGVVLDVINRISE